MKSKLEREIEKNASDPEKRALLLIKIYGQEIRRKIYWEDGKKQAGERIYIPPGGNHPRPKPRENFDGNWRPDSSEYFIIKEFLDKYLMYNTKDAKSVREWFGLKGN